MSVEQQADPRPELSDEEHAAEVAELLNSELLPMIQKSIDAFRRDLPTMLETHRGKWVAYHGDERIGFGRTKADLCQQCLRRGLTRDEFIVCGVEEGVFDPDEEFEVTSPA